MLCGVTFPAVEAGAIMAYLAFSLGKWIVFDMKSMAAATYQGREGKSEPE